MNEISPKYLSHLIKKDGAVLSKTETFEILKEVGTAIQSLLGPYCEIVIHDLSDLEHSIIWISGDVTGRKIGGTMTDLGLEMLRKGQVHPLYNYMNFTENGKTLNSCSIWLRGSDGQIFGSFCINLDVTSIIAAQRFFGSLLPNETQVNIVESYPQDLGELLDTMIAEEEYKIGKPSKKMNKDERLELVRLLDEKGAFQVRNSVSLLANRLGVTKKTIYNYLTELQNKDLLTEDGI